METESNEAQAPAPRNEARYPLAYDASGNPVELPPGAVAWRVRRGGGRRGRPRNVFNAETGRQLEIALGASLQDLIETNVPPDRYLLYPISADGQVIPGVVAVTEVPPDEDDDENVEEGGALGTDSPNPWLAVVARQHATIEKLSSSHVAQSEQLARALGSAVSGYAPVRPPAPIAPTPIVMESPAVPAPAASPTLVESLLSAKPEQLMQFGMIVKHVYDMIRGGAATAGGS
jgi:hypothetical protein